MTTLSAHFRPYSLQVRVLQHKTMIRMQMNTDLYRTGKLPSTLDFLQKHYPDVLQTECFNEEKNPFTVEVQNTEIGHLFEHVVLSSLLSKNKKATYSGWTDWDWKKDRRGSFAICINAGISESDRIFSAIEFADMLLSRLLTTSTDDWGFQPSEPSFVS